MLQSIWSGDGIKFVVGIKGRKVRQIAVPDAREARDKAKQLSAEGYDAYWAMAEFDSNSRKADHVKHIKALWIDLDCGEGKPYPDPSSALEALIAWVRYAGFAPPSHVVGSGHGLHVYWELDQGYPLPAWLPVAQHFKQALALGGVHADPTRTADAASILRVPGTVNYKNKESPVLVELLKSTGKTYSLEEIERRLPAVGPLRVVKSMRDDAWAVPDNYPPGNAEAIAERCQQMKIFREKGGAVSEPYWRAGLSVLKRCENAQIYIHEWSKGDPRYDYDETQEKADRTLGPATCEHFAQVNPGGCLGCAEKVTSPIQLQPPVAAPAEWRKNKVGRFVTTDRGIYFTPPEDGAESVRVTSIPLWIVEVRERARAGDEPNQSSLLIEWRAVDGKTRRAHLFQSNVHDMRVFKTWLADNNIISAVWEVKLLVPYISQYTLTLMKERGAREYYDSLGWYDAGFLIGDTIITPAGPEKALVQSTNPIGKLTPKGDVERWKQAAAVLARKKYARHAMALLTGFASPILELAGVSSAVVSLAGVSGAGKTLAAQFALSIYGDPDFLGQGSTATANSVESQLVANRHVPYLLDEVTNYPPYKLAEFIYLAANGQGKSALKRDRSFRTAGQWRLVPFITSNHPVLDFDQSAIQEAHRRRLVEIYFNEPFPKKDADVLYKAMKRDAGSAGVVYLQEVVRLREKIPAMFEAALEKLRATAPLPEANRFGMWTLAASVVGGVIARKVGLINLDIMKTIEIALGSLEENAAATRAVSEIASDTLREFLTRNSRRICRWDEKLNDFGEVVDNPVARVDSNGIVYVHRAELYQAWYDAKVAKSMIKGWLSEVTIGGKYNTKCIRLAPGTAAVWAIIFDGEKIGMT